MQTNTVAPPLRKDVGSTLGNVLQNKIETRQAKIGVLGLGYVGLPLALEFAKTGFSVTGFEVDPERIRTLQTGVSYIGDVPSEDVRALTEKKRFIPTTNFIHLAEMDVVILCVPTPLSKAMDPDISYIAKATDAVARGLHRPQLIVLESTTYPGTTRDFMLPVLEAKGLRVGKDFFLAFSPERIDPGNPRYNLTNTPKIAGGITETCGQLAELLYSQVVDRVIRVSSPETAEMVKLLENTFRAVNIGLVNELALICDRLKINVWEVIEAAATKPYGFMPFYPGPGLGGHCIPVDPHYLTWKMKSLNYSARFIELAGEINRHMPDFVVEKTSRALNTRKKAMNGSRVLVMGVSYKANVSDVRESPSLDVMRLCMDMGAEVSYHDPFVKVIRLGGKTVTGKPYSQALLEATDVVILTTIHDAFDIKDIVRHAPLVIDTRNATRGMPDANIVRL